MLPQENLSVSALLTCVPAQPLSFFRLLFLECSVDVVLHLLMTAFFRAGCSISPVLV